MSPRSRVVPAIDLFCGAGGLSLGLQDAGFKVVAALDNDPIATDTFARNLDGRPSCGPIEEISAAELLRAGNLSKGECVLLAGGPPCQGFSLQRRGEREDPRNALVLQFVRMVEEIRPQFFLMENVGGLLTKHGKPFLRELALRASRLGYVIHVKLLDAVNFGVPQYRKRAFLVGEMAPDFTPHFVMPSATHAVAFRTVRDAIGNLPRPPQDGSPHPVVANHYREARLAAINIERIQHVPQGGGREDLPPHLQLSCHVNNPKHRHTDVYGRLAWDSPSGTITARFDSFTRGRFAHPEEHRSLTIREGARLQTFPDTFVFSGNREDGARQVGNAVPPLLACHLGQAILEAITARDSGQSIATNDSAPLTHAFIASDHQELVMGGGSGRNRRGTTGSR